LPYLYELVVFVFWLTSPIFYPASFVPSSVRPYLAINPLAQVIEGFRNVAFVPGITSLHTLLFGFVGGLIALVVGSLAFVSLRASFMDLL
jgi:lipopolysaccharide transport system permease protein